MGLIQFIISCMIGAVLGILVANVGIGKILKIILILLLLVLYVWSSISTLMQNNYRGFIFITLATIMMVIVTILFIKTIRKITNY